MGSDGLANFMYTEVNPSSDYVRPSEKNWRPWDFSAGDPRNMNFLQADPKYLTNFAGYDRGHLVSSYSVSGKYEGAARDTFVMPNQVAQNKALNRGAWAQMEHWISNLAKHTDGTIGVITGPIHDNFMPTLGNSKVKVPQRMYKILYHSDKNNRVHYAVFVLPNSKADKPFYQYATDFKTLESATGLHFIFNLNDEDKKVVPAKSDLNYFLHLGRIPQPHYNG
jgi:DNA/RNA endonuclease G (NUC1)